ncbi:ribosome biogenesis protein ERB1-like [Aristolochia californica]|uniref:ribosome biogenesis protein ERB1-like n=1 Tax=Aristolochia californica TaxID=171875 RepID=UPI0035D5DF19
MATCTFDMQFTYILVGWEGSAVDSRVLKLALTRRDKVYVPEEDYMDLFEDEEDDSSDDSGGEHCEDNNESDNEDNDSSDDVEDDVDTQISTKRESAIQFAKTSYY